MRTSVTRFSAADLFVVMLASSALLGGCGKTSSPAAAGTASAPAAAKSDSDAKSPGKAEAGEGLTLTAEQVEKLGVATQPARAMSYSEEVAGYGAVVGHDTIAQAVADLSAAEANERQSSAALERAGKLAGTPGAVSADVQEVAAQKARVDATALTLARQKLTSLFGMNPPWQDGDKDGILQGLAGGEIKLVRVTFPLGALIGGTPTRLRAAQIGIAKPGGGWNMTSVWDAPSDASVPGRSFYALLTGTDAAEGERLQVWAPVGRAISGVEVPAAAAVLSGGKYWCYIETKPGTYTRTEFDTTRPTASGYFVDAGVNAGDKLVVAAAGQLLATQTGSGAESN